MKIPQQPFNGLLWRFLVASENLPFLVCDADMLIDEQNWFISDFSKVQKWLESDKTFFRRKVFLINMAWPISAGTWGGKPTKDGNAAIPDIKNRLENYNHDWFGSDEAFLAKEVWPLFKKEGYFTDLSKNEKIFYIFLGCLIVIFLYLSIRWIKKKKFSSEHSI